jgi:hypothetical protein
VCGDGGLYLKGIGDKLRGKLPAGWTDDMNISVGNGLSQRDVAEYVLDCLEHGLSHEEIHTGLTRTFALSCHDADLALDRAQGGIIRALTGSISNAPDNRKDPIARRTFDIVWSTLPRKSFFSRDRVSTGRWEEWYRSR